MRGVGKGWVIPTLSQRMLLERGFDHAQRDAGVSDPVARKHALREYRAGLPVLLMQRINALPPNVAIAAAEGAGFTIGARLTPYQPILTSMLEPLQELPTQLAESFFRAMGEGYRVRFSEASYVAPAPGDLRIEAWLGEAARGWFHEGLRAPADGL